MSQKHLIILDFPGIKKFVFGTDRLVEIRGASALLDELNRDIIPELLKKRFGQNRCRCVFASGGACQFIIDDGFENIHEAIAELQGEVFEQTGGALRMVAGIAPFAEDNYARSLKHAFLDLKKVKTEDPFEPTSPIHTGFIRECDSCSDMATEWSDYAGESKMLCATCHLKEKSGRDRGLWQKFAECMNRNSANWFDIEKQRPKDFEEIGQRCQARRGYTALVYGDGNAMGQLVKKINSAERFERFSKAVDESIRDACYEALQQHCNIVGGKIPADILLLGGDDLVVYLSADTALPFALEVIRLFEEKTREKLMDDDSDTFFKEKLGENGLTLSIGIAFGRSHTPISIMFDQAEELLKSAKLKGSEIGSKNEYTPACIDFHLTSRFNKARLKDCRKDLLVETTSRGETLRYYRGPYTFQEAQNLMTHAHRLKSSGIPNSRLHRLGEAPFKKKINGTIETLTLYGRCRKSEQKKAIQEALSCFDCWTVMPWNEGPDETTTVLVDLVEIANFTSLRKEDAQNATSHPA